MGEDVAVWEAISKLKGYQYWIWTEGLLITLTFFVLYVSDWHYKLMSSLLATLMERQELLLDVTVYTTLSELLVFIGAVNGRAVMAGCWIHSAYAKQQMQC